VFCQTPSAVPIVTPSSLQSVFEFLLNLRTAKVLGLTVPQTLLARTDEVVE